MSFYHFVIPIYSLCSSGTPANIRAKTPGQVDGQSFRLPRDALGFLHSQIPACTGQQPPILMQPHTAFRWKTSWGRQPECLCLLFRYFPSERDNGLQHLDLCFLHGKWPPFPFSIPRTGLVSLPLSVTHHTCLLFSFSSGSTSFCSCFLVLKKKK